MATKKTKTATKKSPPRKPRETQKYVRNIRNVPISVRLNANERRISLKARGQRGDCAPISKAEMEDEIFLGNLDLLYEVIPVSEAKEIIQKQTTNQQVRHSAMDHIVNAQGDPYEKGVVVEEEHENQGKIVAHLNPQGNTVNIDRVALPGTVDKENQIAARTQELENARAELNKELEGLKITKDEVQRN